MAKRCAPRAGLNLRVTEFGGKHHPRLFTARWNPEPCRLVPSTIPTGAKHYCKTHDTWTDGKRCAGMVRN